MKKWKILKMDKKETKKGTPYNNLFIKNMDENETRGIDVYGNIEERGITKGIVVALNKENVKAREYKGKTYYSCNSKDLEIIHSETPRAPSEPVPVSVWDKKDRMIVRQNVLNRAVELVIATGKVTLGELPDAIGVVEKTAEVLETWVMRNGCRPDPMQEVAEKHGEIKIDAPEGAKKEEVIEDIPFDAEWD